MLRSRSERRHRGAQDVRRGRVPSGRRPVHHSSTSPRPLGGVGKESIDHSRGQRRRRLQSTPRPRAMSYPCTSNLLQPSAMNPPGSVGPQCHARAPAGVATTVLDSNRAVDSITMSSPDGGTSARTTRSTGKYFSRGDAATCRAWAAMSWATCAAVSQLLHSRSPAAELHSAPVARCPRTSMTGSCGDGRMRNKAIEPGPSDQP
jgi:hypothetical protein